MKIEQRISGEEATQAQRLYDRIGALNDLKKTIETRDDKNYLMGEVEQDMLHADNEINNWWKNISEKYQTEFSDQARVFFDDWMIIDN